MKTNLLNLSAVAVVALLGQASAAVSSNIVGYVKQNFAKGYSLVTNPLNNTAASGNTVGVLFGSIDCDVLRWTGSGFKTTTIAEGAGVVDGPDFVLNPGEAVFVNVTAAKSVTFVGDAVLVQSVPYVKGNNFLGSAIPLSGNLTALNLLPGSGDSVLTWTGTGYKTYPSDAEAGYYEGEPTLAVGQGVVLQANGPGAWGNTYTVN